MASSKLFNLLVGAVLSLGFSPNVSAQDDSLVASEFNQHIRELLLSKPPIIQFAVFKNRRLIRGEYVTSVYRNGIKWLTSSKKQIVLDTSALHTGDSLQFVISYRRHTISTRKVSYKRYLHGGKATFGLVDDFGREEKDFQLNQQLFLAENDKNMLYTVMLQVLASRRYTTKNPVQLRYSVLASNTSEGFQISYDFF